MIYENPRIECPECKELFLPERPSRAVLGGCCSRRCARIRQARHGEPSLEDKKARFVDVMMQKFDEIFKLK